MDVLRYQYQKARKFQKKNLKFILPLTTLLFIVAIVVFSIYLSMHPAAATRLLFLSGDRINDGIQISGFLPALAENLFTGLYLIVLGIVPFLFIPLWFVVFNGSLIGILLGSTSISSLTTGILVTYLIPHGLVLIPAMLLASSYGIYLCKRVILHVLHKKPIESFTELFLELGRGYVFLILPLMLIATVLKIVITPFIMMLF